MGHDLAARIAHLDPCRSAVEWLKSLPDATTPQEAWEACAQPDWLLWLVTRQDDAAADGPLRRRLAKTMCRLVRAVMADDPSPVRDASLLRDWASADRASLEAALERIETHCDAEPRHTSVSTRLARLTEEAAGASQPYTAPPAAHRVAAAVMVIPSMLYWRPSGVATYRFVRHLLHAATRKTLTYSHVGVFWEETGTLIFERWCHLVREDFPDLDFMREVQP